MKSGAMLGKTPSEVIEYLKNPLNDEILMDMVKTVEQYWNS
jgi:arsenate reductase-like glutaredoxin family protein